MSSKVRIHDGTLLWSGEHWINAIRADGQTNPSAWISLFHTRYSPAGEGNAAQVIVPESKISVICADNVELARWCEEQFFSRSSFRDPNARTVEARFARGGRIDREPSWTIETSDHRIVARWRVTHKPVIASGAFRQDRELFTILCFTDDSSVEVDGRAIPGRPFPRDIWQPTIGGERSSSVFALGETMVEV